MMAKRILLAVFVITSTPTFALSADPDANTETVEATPNVETSLTAFSPNRADEPIRDEFSKRKAIEFLDNASLQWKEKRKCFTCHTNLAYLYARPAIIKHVEHDETLSHPPAHEQVRTHADELIRDRWPEKGPRWDTEVVAIAAALAYSDAKTNGTLAKFTRVALDRMWTLQREDGGWDWLKCGWPPMESDDHYGATVAAIATGVAPDNYRETNAAKAGLEKLKSYLANNPPPTLHHKAMLLWSARYQPELITEQNKQETVRELLELQRSDGGWATASLGDWERGDGKEQDTTTSDGYGTGFVVFVLRQADVPKSEESIQKGIRWLKSNQRQSGRWFARSLYKDNKHYLTHAGSAFAVMALDACDAF